MTVHLLAAAPNRSYLEAHGFGLDRYIAHPLEIQEGFAVAPDRPGHGMGFDWKGLEACRAWRFRNYPAIHVLAAV